ncbi:hypothetical protein [Lichenibacterium dinghuense]|uniref:hypothetical protein n=1 Tax=Lichenibacterium dinghuense TaxID=2895977 RepID=UPI001F4559F5|nr:hypothetical protein [Lichenibacterium sp. 6Y81]
MVKLPLALIQDVGFQEDCRIYFTAVYRTLLSKTDDNTTASNSNPVTHGRDWGFMRHASIRDHYLRIEKHVRDALSAKDMKSEHFEEVISDIASWPIPVEDKIRALTSGLEKSSICGDHFIVNVGSFRVGAGKAVRVKFADGVICSIDQSESINIDRDSGRDGREADKTFIDRSVLVEHGFSGSSTNLVFARRSSNYLVEDVDLIGEIGNVWTSLARLSFLNIPALKSRIPPAGAVEMPFIDDGAVTPIGLRWDGANENIHFGFPRSCYDLDDQMVYVLESVREVRLRNLCDVAAS